MFKYFVLLVLGLAGGAGAAYVAGQNEFRLGAFGSGGERRVATAADLMTTSGSASISEDADVIYIAFGPVPEASFDLEIDGDIEVAGQSVPIEIDMDGAVRGEQTGSEIGLTLNIDRMNVRAADQRMSQPLDLTANYRFNTDGALIQASVDGDFGSIPVPVSIEQQYLDYLAPSLPFDGVAVGDQFQFSDRQRIDGPVNGMVRVDTTVTVVARTTYQGREGVILQLNGTINGPGMDGQIVGEATLDTETSFVIEADLNFRMSASVQGRPMAMQMAMAFATDF